MPFMCTSMGFEYGSEPAVVTNRKPFCPLLQAYDLDARQASRPILIFEAVDDKPTVLVLEPEIDLRVYSHSNIHPQKIIKFISVVIAYLTGLPMFLNCLPEKCKLKTNFVS